VRVFEDNSARNVSIAFGWATDDSRALCEASPAVLSHLHALVLETNCDGLPQLLSRCTNLQVLWYDEDVNIPECSHQPFLAVRSVMVTGEKDVWRSDNKLQIIAETFPNVEEIWLDEIEVSEQARKTFAKTMQCTLRVVADEDDFAMEIGKSKYWGYW